MHEYIARLIRCGMPREVAVCVCKQYFRRKQLWELDQYVYSVEQETKEREEWEA